MRAKEESKSELLVSTQNTKQQQVTRGTRGNLNLTISSATTFEAAC